MPSKITKREIYRQIVRQNDEDFRDARERGVSTVPYSYSNFRADMFANDFIGSATTMKVKWDSVKVDELFTTTANGKTMLHIPTLYILAGVTVPLSGASHTHITHTPKEESE